jgi:GNAT superfamily N-acetyltransferase
VIRLDPSRKEEALQAGFDACRAELEPHREGYFAVVREWNPIAVCDDDKVIGILTAKDDVIHLAIVPEYRGRWASRRVIREMLKYGKTTTVGQDNSFIERVGFRREGPVYRYMER